MHPNDPEESRVETITAALVYLIDAAPVLRDICAALHGAWANAAADSQQIH